MIIGFVAEKWEWEYRVALVPQTVHLLTKMGHEVYFEKNAGIKAGFSDEDYIKNGAKLFTDATNVYKKSEIIVKINAPVKQEYKYLHKDLWIIANFSNMSKDEQLSIIKKYKVKIVALDQLPRLSRVQDIDILSSQNNLAGYKAALIAMNMQNKSVPLMMTSAGTVPALKALVLGVGVAGLQAIATLQRMGAIVYASDVRAETAEQVMSLGAKFIISSNDNIFNILKNIDILITSAYSSNGYTPQLITLKMLKQMPLGSIIIDMANGNVEGGLENSVKILDNVKILSSVHLAADVAYSASGLFSRNIYNLLSRWDELLKDDEVWSKILIQDNKGI